MSLTVRDVSLVKRVGKNISQIKQLTAYKIRGGGKGVVFRYYAVTIQGSVGEGACCPEDKMSGSLS
jgi:hypothetical protein